MNVDALRRWVRNELDPASRREVGRWMLRSTDPKLPGLLYGLVKEHEEELANAALRRAFPARGFLLDMWDRLVEAQRATLESLRPPTLAGGAVLGGGAEASVFSFRKLSDDEVVIDVVIADKERLVALFATTDLGDEHLLFGPEQLAPGTHVAVAGWRPEPHEGRVVWWLVSAPVGTSAELVRTMASVDSLAVDGAVEVHAARWTAPE